MLCQLALKGSCSTSGIFWPWRCYTAPSTVTPCSLSHFLSLPDVSLLPWQLPFHHQSQKLFSIQRPTYPPSPSMQLSPLHQTPCLGIWSRHRSAPSWLTLGGFAMEHGSDLCSSSPASYRALQVPPGPAQLRAQMRPRLVLSTLQRPAVL